MLALRRRLAVELGREVHEERLRRGWPLIKVAARAGIAASTHHRIEAGAPSSLDGYVRRAATLGLEPTFGLSRDRLPASQRAVDPVHAAMGEAEAAHLGELGYEVLLDEPYHRPR